MRLLLFDIDGTLIRGNRAGRLAMAAALKEMVGSAGPLDNYEMGGKTDARIMTDMLVAIGVNEDEIETILPKAFELMAKKAEGIYPEKGITTCPGVIELLENLRNRCDVLLGLLTGNTRPTAALKLSAAGIDPAQFVVGAFGSDHLDRNQLPVLALRRVSELTGLYLTGDNTVIIGDTPADIACARAGKAKAVAVASGWHSFEELSTFAPDILLEDFSDTQQVLESLLR